jgi:hypothetical protein
MMARPFNPRPARPGTISRPTIARPGRPVIQRPSVGSWGPYGFRKLGGSRG